MRQWSCCYETRVWDHWSMVTWVVTTSSGCVNTPGVNLWLSSTGLLTSNLSTCAEFRQRLVTSILKQNIREQGVMFMFRLTPISTIQSSVLSSISTNFIYYLLIILIELGLRIARHWINCVNKSLIREMIVWWVEWISWCPGWESCVEAVWENTVTSASHPDSPVSVIMVWTGILTWGGRDQLPLEGLVWVSRECCSSSLVLRTSRTRFPSTDLLTVACCEQLIKHDKQWQSMFTFNEIINTCK